MKYITSVKLSNSEIDFYNKLLAIDNLNDLSDDEMRELGASDYGYMHIFCVSFDNGTYINVDVCSGGENYYDDVYFCDTDGNYINFDSEYEIDDIEFEVDNDTYKVIIERI